MTFTEELFDESRFGTEVLITDLRSVLHFLHADVLRLATRLFGLLGFVELELSVVHDAAHRRTRRRGDLHQIQIKALRQRERFTRRRHAALIALMVDEADRVHANTFVHAVVTRHCCDNSLLANNDTRGCRHGERGENGRTWRTMGGEVEVGEPTSLAVNYRTTLADVSTSPENSDDVFTESEMEALRATPPEIVIANHVFHLLELAAIHVSATPPQLAEAQVTIDAVAGVMGAVGDRLGEPSALLSEALAQIQLAYVRVAADAAGE